MEASCREVGGYGTINNGAGFTTSGFSSAPAARSRSDSAGSKQGNGQSNGRAARPTVADVLRNHVPAYLRKYPQSVTSHQRYVLGRLMDCRTEALGGHGWNCGWCGHCHYSNESCNNRHCPTCGGPARHRWLEKMLSWSLPTSYFHVVVTLPHEFCSLIHSNPKALYGLLFQAAQQALLSLGVDRLGATLGALIVLHTWGQAMNRHVHLHMIVTAGGLSLDGTRWISATDRESFLKQEELAERFRELFLKGLRRLHRRGELTLPKSMSWVNTAEDLERWLKPVLAKDWNVHCQPPPKKCQGPEAVLNYLAQYVSGTAISDARIVSDDGIHVTFMAKDYRNNTRKPKPVKGEEFVKRFTWHILPRRFRRIRYCGLFGPRKRIAMLPLCRQLLSVGQPEHTDDTSQSGMPTLLPQGEQGEALDPPAEPEPRKATRPCPRCGMPGMEWFGRFNRGQVHSAIRRLSLLESYMFTILSTTDIDRLLRLSAFDFQWLRELAADYSQLKWRSWRLNHLAWLAGGSRDCPLDAVILSQVQWVAFVLPQVESVSLPLPQW